MGSPENLKWMKAKLNARSEVQLLNTTAGLLSPEGLVNDEKAEHGLIEEAGKTIREFVCTFISQIEYGIDDRLELGLDIIPWIVR